LRQQGERKSAVGEAVAKLRGGGRSNHFSERFFYFSNR
jgi:hypothetical protein